MGICVSLDIRNRAQQPRWRVVFPFSESVSAAEWKELYPKLREALGRGFACEGDAALQQAYFTPSCPEAALPGAFAEVHEGEWLDASEFRGSTSELELASPEPQQVAPGTGDYKTSISLPGLRPTTATASRSGTGSMPSRVLGRRRTRPPARRWTATPSSGKRRAEAGRASTVLIRIARGKSLGPAGIVERWRPVLWDDVVTHCGEPERGGALVARIGASGRVLPYADGRLVCVVSNGQSSRELAGALLCIPGLAESPVPAGNECVCSDGRDEGGC